MGAGVSRGFGSRSGPAKTDLKLARPGIDGRIGKMPPLAPRRNVTFLFTDIERSSELWEKHPQAMGRALDQHDRLLRTTFDDNRGNVFKTVGDAFCVAFESTSDAVLASLAAPLATAGISLFVVSTFETDYLLVTQEQLASAIAALDRAGHSIHRSEHE